LIDAALIPSPVIKLGLRHPVQKRKKQKGLQGSLTSTDNTGQRVEKNENLESFFSFKLIFRQCHGSFFSVLYGKYPNHFTGLSGW